MKNTLIKLIRWSGVAEREGKRKLAAVLSADVKGYSQLLAQDETGTLKVLLHFQQLIKELVEQYGGRVVQSAGDGVLAEFASVLDAAECAIETQQRIRSGNHVSEGRKMEFRIGISLGDVIEEGETIFGEAVNIAERVQALAHGGGICVTKAVYQQLNNKLNLSYEYLGRRALKNIDLPIGVYRVLTDRQDLTVKRWQWDKAAVRRWWALPQSARAALILAFATGLVWVLQASFTVFHKGQQVMPPVQPCTAQDTPQALVAPAPTPEPTKAAEKASKDAARTVPAVNAEARIAYAEALRHYRYIWMQPDGIAKARFNLEKAVELDPNYSEAQALLAMVYWLGSTNGDLYMQLGEKSWYEARLKCAEYLRKAMLRPTAMAHTVAGLNYLWRRQYEQALVEAHKSVALEPTNQDSIPFAAYTMILAGEPDEGAEILEKATRLDPHVPSTYQYYIGVAAFCRGNLEKAAECADTVMKMNPGSSQRAGFHTAVFALLGRPEESRKTFGTFVSKRKLNVTIMAYHWPFRDPALSDRFAEGLVKAGLPDGPIGNPKIIPENRIAGKELRSLFMGRKVSTKGTANEVLDFVTQKDGRAILVAGGDDSPGKVWVEGDTVCARWDKTYGGLPYCGTVYRNPNGTQEKGDPYFWISEIGLLMVSSSTE